MAAVNKDDAQNLLADLQTNGGLLISVSEEAAEEVKELFIENGYEDWIEPIGVMLCAQSKVINLK